ncbi:MAG: sulfotransferase [Cephaloticoccus sp.]|nr:sulfotransferase [Cephaloticoccus sp.]
MLVTVIGRGHSGTRAMSHTLSQSGVFMGEQVNESGDLVPAQALYDACRIIAKQVRWRGGLDWDFSQLETAAIPPEFESLVRTYLQSVLASPADHRGWKLPETTLVFPWILRLFPEAKYIFWIRDPRDCILGRHLTDDLAWIDVPAPVVTDDLLRRAISWQYQYNLVKATHPPANWIEVRFEDFVLQQEVTLARLEKFLGIPLVKIPVRPETVERWRSHPDATTFDFLAPALRNYGYELSAGTKLQTTALC